MIEELARYAGLDLREIAAGFEGERQSLPLAQKRSSRSKAPVRGAGRCRGGEMGQRAVFIACDAAVATARGMSSARAMACQHRPYIACSRAWSHAPICSAANL
jgi:hypothetical protein